MMLVAAAADYTSLLGITAHFIAQVVAKEMALSGCGSGALSHPKETSGFRIIWDRDGLDFHRVSIF